MWKLDARLPSPVRRRWEAASHERYPRPWASNQIDGFDVYASDDEIYYTRKYAKPPKWHWTEGKNSVCPLFVLEAPAYHRMQTKSERGTALTGPDFRPKKKCRSKRRRPPSITREGSMILFRLDRWRLSLAWAVTETQLWNKETSTPSREHGQLNLEHGSMRVTLEGEHSAQRCFTVT